MSRSWLCICLFGVLLLGCQQHVKDKQAALDRWNKARAQMSIKMAQQQFQAGDLEAAANEAKEVLALDAQCTEATFLLGQIHLERGQLPKARQNFEQCLLEEPSDAKASYYLGIIYERHGELERAERYYRQAWLNDSAQAEYLLATAHVLTAQGSDAEALDLLKDQVDRGMADASVCMAAGQVLMRLDQRDEAVTMFEKALRISPNDAMILESLAFACHEAGQTHKSLALFEQLVAQCADQSEQVPWPYYLAMGDCYMDMGQFHRAQRCYEQITRQEESNAVVWARLARTALGKGKLEQVQTYSDRALALDADLVDALMVAGYAAMKQGKYEPARKNFERIIESDNQNNLAYCLLGLTHEATGRQQLAVACYNQALKISPSDDLAGRLMASVRNGDELQQRITDVEASEVR